MTIEISEISKLEYRNIEISVGRIEISVSEISDPGAGSETGMQIKISKQHYHGGGVDNKVPQLHATQSEPLD